jgi:hypothetical protein
MRRAMGVAVFAGMLGVTLFGLALTPVFYWTIRRLTGARPRPVRWFRQLLRASNRGASVKTPETVL